MSDEAKQIRAFVAQVDAGDIAWNSAKWPKAREAFLAGAEALERVAAKVAERERDASKPSP